MFSFYDTWLDMRLNYQYNFYMFTDTHTNSVDVIGKKQKKIIDDNKLHLLSNFVNRSTNEVFAIFNQWKMEKYHDNPKVDLDLIARLLGVSKTTISNYINNNLAHVSKKKQETIKQIINILAYVPNYSARIIKRNIKKTYGIIANISETPSREYTGTLLKALHRKSEEVDYSLQLYDVKQDKQSDLIKKMPFFGVVDGLFIIGSDLEQGMYELLEQYSIPLVLLDPWNDIVGKNVIATVHAQLNGLEDLFAHAHSNISNRACLITIRPEHYKERQEKIDLFASIYEHQPVVYVDDYSAQSAIKVFDEIKERDESVFLCLSDMTAMVLKEKFAQAGRAVYITGYDNSDVSSVFHIPTVDHNLKQQAEVAFDAMHKSVKYFQKHGIFPKRKKIMLESLFVEKSTH